MSQNKIVLLQSIGIFLQLVNAGIGTATHNATLTLLIGAGVAAYQYYTNHLGNQSIPLSYQGSQPQEPGK